MKTKIVLFCLIAHFLGCSTESNQTGKTIEEIERDSITRPIHISTNAWLVNRGFVDRPIFNWVEYIGNYKNEKGKLYPHIYQFKYLDEFGYDQDTLNYEWNENRLSDMNLGVSEFSDYSLILHPGAGTLLLKKGTKEIKLIHVLEFHEFDRDFRGISYFRIPMARIDSMYLEDGLAYHGDTEINVKLTREGNYKVKLINEKGIREINYKINGDCKNKSKISYLNKENGHIYFVENNCYLKLINPEDLERI